MTPTSPRTTNPDDHLPLTWLAYLVLLSVADRPLHGYGIIKEVEARSGGRTRIEAGTLYAAIKRLRDQRLLAPSSTAQPDAGSRRRRDYELTPLGREVLELESERLAGLVDVARAKRVLRA